MAEIDALFTRPGYFDETPAGEVKRLQEERTRLEDRLIPDLMAEWEDVESALADAM